MSKHNFISATNRDRFSLQKTQEALSQELRRDKRPSGEKHRELLIPIEPASKKGSMGKALRS